MITPRLGSRYGVLLTCLLTTGALWRTSAAAGATATSVHQTPNHAMRYHLALPSGWTSGRSWPVLVVIPDAARDFEGNLARFLEARGDRPYILVAPEVLSCGGIGSRTADRYTYERAVWDTLRIENDFAFEDAGLAAVLTDVHQRWHGESKAFLTGWEAGGHTVWAQTLRHPERWRGVAPVSPNYLQRGLGEAAFSRRPDRARLPIQVFRCGAPTGEAIRAIASVDQQASIALRDARSHGFRPRSVRVVAGADHGPLPGTVLAWCDSLRSR